MKSFMIFLGVALVLIGAFIYYNIQHPSDTMIVRSGGHWTVFEHNVTHPAQK